MAMVVRNGVVVYLVVAEGEEVEVGKVKLKAPELVGMVMKEASVWT